MGEVSVGELAGAVFPRDASGRVMALLSGVFDASFTDNGRPIRVSAIGGFIGLDNDWRKVEEAWAPNRERWGLEEFRLAQILAGRTVVPQSQAEKCIGSFRTIIARSGLVEISASMRVDDWEVAFKDPEYLAKYPRSYHACLHMLFNLLDQHMKLEHASDSIAIIMDTDETGDLDALGAICDEWRQNASQFVSIAFTRRAQFRLIETADLCAGAHRMFWRAGGFDDTFMARPLNRLHRSGAIRARSAHWSLEQQRRIENILKARRERENKG